MSVNTTNNLHDKLTTLDQTRKNELWKTNVSDAGWKWVFVVLPLLSYAYDVWSESATTRDYNQKFEALINAVANRLLNTEEANGGVSKDAEYAEELRLVADKAEDAFLAAFKARCTKLGVDTHAYYGAALEALNKAAQAKDNSLTSISSANRTTSSKIATNIQNLNGKVFTQEVDALVNLPAGQISPSKYKRAIETVSKFFSNDITADRADFIIRNRGEIKGQSQAFADLSAKYGAVNNNEMLAGMETKLQTKFNTRKAALETRMTLLRGSNGDNGEINTAYLAQVTATTALTAARTAFQQVLLSEGLINNLNNLGSDQAIFDIAHTSLTPAFTTALTTFRNAFTAHKTAVENKQKLDTELGEIATFGNNGQIIGGKIHGFDQKLAGIQGLARDKANKKANFYAELATSNANGMEASTRSAAMQRILNVRITNR
jgi:hypothetical protein